VVNCVKGKWGNAVGGQSRYATSVNYRLTTVLLYRSEWISDRRPAACSGERRKGLENIRRCTTAHDDGFLRCRGVEHCEPCMGTKRLAVFENAKVKVRVDAPRMQEPLGSQRLNKTRSLRKQASCDHLHRPADPIVRRVPCDSRITGCPLAEKPTKRHASKGQPGDQHNHERLDQGGLVRYRSASKPVQRPPPPADGRARSSRAGCL